MTYIPKNQIQTNLYSNADFVTIPDYETYTGYYWKKSTGQKYTGRTPNDGINKRLIPLIPEQQPGDIDQPITPPLRNDDVNSYQYDSITSNKYRPIRRPITFFTKPNNNDYINGFFFRYFAKQRNQNTLFETSKDEFELLNKNTRIVNTNLYRGIRVMWSISKKDREEIYLTNKNIVNNLETTRNFYGLTNFFNDDFDKFYSDKIGIIYLNGKRNYTSYQPIPSNLPPSYQWGNKNNELVNPETPPNQNCALCIFRKNNLCEKWNANIKKDFWCKSYQPKENVSIDELKDYTSENTPNIGPINQEATTTSTTSNQNTQTNQNTGTSATITTTYSFGGGGGY